MSLSKQFDEKTKIDNIINEHIFIQEASKYFLNAKKFIKDTYGGELLEYTSSGEDAKFKCNKGHIFIKLFYNLKRRGFCNECNGSPGSEENKRKMLQIAKDLAIAKKGLCLSTEFVSMVSKLHFRCFYGHEWFANLKNLKNKSTWCKQCSGSMFLSEEIVRKIFELLFNEKFPKSHPEWLEGLELDCYCESLGLAAEYDGEQHFKQIKHYHKTLEKFEEQKKKRC